MEYVWSVYHMDSECIDFCWFESINQGQKKQLIFNSQGYTYCTKLLRNQDQLTFWVVGILPKRDSWCFKSTKCSWDLTKHSIAQNHGLFLTLSVFLLSMTHCLLSRGIYGYVTFPPFITMVLSKYSVLATGYAKFKSLQHSIKYVCVFIFFIKSHYLMS
jgi:hypothetical protein